MPKRRWKRRRKRRETVTTWIAILKRRKGRWVRTTNHTPDHTAAINQRCRGGDIRPGNDAEAILWGKPLGKDRYNPHIGFSFLHFCRLYFCYCVSLPTLVCSFRFLECSALGSDRVKVHAQHPFPLHDFPCPSFTWLFPRFSPP